MEIKVKFGDLIRELRLEHGLKKRALARLIKCDAKTIGNIESYETPQQVQDTNLFGLAKVFGMSELELLREWRQRNQPEPKRFARKSKEEFEAEMAATYGKASWEEFKAMIWGYYRAVVEDGPKQESLGTSRAAEGEKK